MRRSRTRRIAELRDHRIVDFDRAAYRASHIALSAATNYRQRDPTVIRPTFYNLLGGERAARTAAITRAKPAGEGVRFSV